MKRYNIDSLQINVWLNFCKSFDKDVGTGIPDGPCPACNVSQTFGEKIASPHPHHFQLNTGSVVRQNKKSTAVAMLGRTAYNYRLDILILTSFVQGGLLQKKSIACAMLGRSKWTRARSVATTPSNYGFASI